MLTVLVAMFICVVMVTALLVLTLRFPAEVVAADSVAGVVAAELLCTFPASVLEERNRNKQVCRTGSKECSAPPNQEKCTALQLPVVRLKVSMHHEYIRECCWRNLPL